MQQYAYPVVVGQPQALKSQRAGSSGRIILARALSSCGAAASSSQASDVPSLLAKYDTLGRDIQNLAATVASKSPLERKVQEAEQKLAVNAADLRRNRQAQPHTERRLERNAHPHLLHYLQLNREQKVRNLQADLENLRAEEVALEKQKVDLEANLQEFRRQLSGARDAEQRMQQFQSQRESIFETVVNLTSGSSSLSILQTERSALETDLRLNRSLLTSLQETMNQVNTARQLFATAHSELERASRDNRMAEYEAEVDMYEMWGEADGYERRLQRDRDRMLNLAKQNAQRAGEILQAAFDSFSMEARIRYPELTRNVCNAPIPRLQGGNFNQALNADWWGGAYGAMNNDLMAEGKINRNVSILRQCEALALEQANCIQQILNFVHSQVLQTERNLSSMSDRISSEKRALFESARHTYFPHNVSLVPDHIPSAVAY